MTHDGTPQEHYEGDVARGVYDDNIKDLCEGLKRFNRPVFLRIG